MGVPADPEAAASTKAVLAYLAALSNDTVPGVIAGQNIGHSQDFDSDGRWLDGYSYVIGTLQTLSGEVPGMVGVDYEYLSVASPDRLGQVNRYLTDYWNAGGLVTINWSPHFPLWDTVKGDRTRTASGPLGSFRLKDLIDPKKPVSALWEQKLSVIADALSELQAAGVVVLWRPMQEMNGDWFWWGKRTSSPKQYQAVWRAMFRYFTETRKLHNLLWVFSPNPSPQTQGEQNGIDPMAWYYPGNRFVDVVAGTRYRDDLGIPDYTAYQKFGKPLGVGEYGPTLEGGLSRSGTFDTLRYRDRLLSSYPKIAYWVSWHSWYNADGSKENQALVSNKNAAQLLQDPLILTRSRVRWRDFLN